MTGRHGLADLDDALDSAAARFCHVGVWADVTMHSNHRCWRNRANAWANVAAGLWVTKPRGVAIERQTLAILQWHMELDHAWRPSSTGVVREDRGI